MPDRFDPLAALKELDRQRVAYLVVGALARVIHGSDELTHGLDIVPSTKAENLRRLGVALAELGAQRADGKKLEFERDLLEEPVLELDTVAGELKVVREPAGTRGYDDLRRGASREPLGQGVRPAVASIGDLARMLDVEHDREPLRTLHRMIELERDLGRGISRER